MNKIDLRKKYLSKRMDIPQATLNQASKKAQWHLKEFIDKNKLSKVFLFASFKNEIDLLSGFITESRTSVHLQKVALPKIYPSDKQMVFFSVETLNQLVKNKYGIWEPKEESSRQIPDSQTLICVPALTIDRNTGHRLGYGGGYYDRYLASIGAEVMTMGVVMEQMISEEGILADSFDIPVRYLLTEKGIIKIP